MLNNSVVSFHGNFGLIFKGSEDKATDGTAYWLLSITSLLIDPCSSLENHSEYPHKPYITRNLWQTFLSLLLAMTTPVLFEAPLPWNPHKYPQEPYTAWK